MLKTVDVIFGRLLRKLLIVGLLIIFAIRFFVLAFVLPIHTTLVFIDGFIGYNGAGKKIIYKTF